MATPRPRVFLDVSHASEPLGRLTIELFNDKAPRTSENFLALCSGSKPPLTYKMARFHRVIDNFMVQGGDITKGDGTGGDSIYGGDFADENLGWRDMEAKGLVCMANRGRDSNSSQFFITLAPVEHLNGKHTIFGQLVSGEDTLDRMSQVTVDKNDKPITDVIISNCGELERRIKALPKTTRKSHRSSKAASSQSESSDRGRKKRQRSAGSDQSSSASHSEKYRKRTHRPLQSLFEEGVPTKGRNRRRSDHSIDETLRGRPRRRSRDRMRISSSIREDAAEDDDLPMSDDKAESPRQDRKRSRSPSRSRHRLTDSSQSQGGFRRRRSLPNQYEWRRQSATIPDREVQLGHDQRTPGNGKNGRGKQGSNAGEGRLGNNATLHSDDGDAGFSGSEIKFKGRGSMKYRERKR